MTYRRNKMKKIFFLLLIILPYTYSQTYNIKGVVSASNTPVRNASVKFINNSTNSVIDSLVTDSLGNYQIEIITATKSNINNLPSKFELEQNYPNPFSASTNIPYQLNTQSDVQVTIYDVLGRAIRKFSFNSQAVGTHNILWNGKNNFGQKIAAGVYFYRVQAGEDNRVMKMVYSANGSNLSVPLPNLVSSNISEIGKSYKANIQSVSYTVQIRNTSTTYPSVNPFTISTVVIQSDTTLNFTVSSSNAVVYLDSSHTQQIIRGFGGMNMPDWIPDMTTAQVNTAFGTGTGQIGLTLLRIKVIDDSTQFFREVPTAKLAYSMGALIMATPWSPPPSMKSNNSIVEGTLDTSKYAAFALYEKSFADYMSANGAPLYAVSVQNEPDASVTYESCDWNATQLLNFCKNNAPVVGTKIIMPESQNFVHALSDPTLKDSAACANVSIIAGHIYGGGLTSYPLAVSKGKEIWMTEHEITDTTWSGVLSTGKEINDCMSAGMSAYFWWYIVRYYGLINGIDNVTPRGYVMSQYSRFIRPGFYRISATGNPSYNVYATAYKNGPKVVIVVVNMSSSSVTQSFSVENGTMSTFTQYTTSSTKHCAQGNDINVTNGEFTSVLDASSVTTFVSN